MKVKITFEADYYEEWDEVESLMKSRQYSSHLFEIYQIARSQLKHGERKDDFQKLEEILEYAGIAVE